MMRLPRARFTVRWLMIAVAVTAIAFGLQRRAAFCYRMAEYHDSRHQIYYFVVDGELAGFDRRFEPVSNIKNRWHEEMIVIYERASRFPWFPIWYTPPEPE
jgi:hypothetical protein